MLKRLLVLILIALFFGNCQYHFVPLNYRTVTHIPSVRNNVCKTLKGKVVLYAIFVDSKYTAHWTEYDINSTLDTIRNAITWMENEAAKKGIGLDIKLDYYQKKNQIPIEANFQRRTLSATLFAKYAGVRNVDRWADKIAKEALKSFGKDTSSLATVEIKPKDRVSLLARLRDKYQTDNVALMYFINNFFSDEISVAMHTLLDDTPEYAIVSYKQQAVVAHEFLHLFGAIDLYISPFDKRRQTRRKKSLAMKKFPDEIMAFPYRRISVLNISPFTQYLIGWQNELDEEYKKMLIGRKITVAKY